MSKLLFRDDLKLKENEKDLEGFFNCCSSFAGRFSKLFVFMIINAVVGVVFFYNPLWNLKEYKRFHRRVKIDTTFP